MTNKQKGNLLENIVALMHEWPGVDVKPRERLPVLNSQPIRFREIDVLLTAQAAGYPVRFAISCKNIKSKVGVEVVGDFCHALTEIGIPAQFGILVSVNGFTSGALDSAKSNGLRLLIYKGFTADRLRQEINAALHSTVYLLTTVETLSVLPFVPAGASSDRNWTTSTIDSVEPPALEAIYRYLWKMWMRGEFADRIGDQTAAIFPRDVSAHWIVIAELQVSGWLASITGIYSESALIDARNNRLDRLHVAAKFDQPPVNQTLSAIESEAALAKLVEEQGLHILTRVRVPRFATKAGYWPPTVEEAEHIKRLFEEGRPINFEELAGNNLGDAWR